MSIKQGRARQKDKWFHFHPATDALYHKDLAILFKSMTLLTAVQLQKINSSQGFFKNPAITVVRSNLF